MGSGVVRYFVYVDLYFKSDLGDSKGFRGEGVAALALYGFLQH